MCAVLTELHVRFQGGFAGKECIVRVGAGNGEEGREIAKLHPSDNNSLQVSPSEITLVYYYIIMNFIMVLP